jgi:hypothetical protein
VSLDARLRMIDEDTHLSLHPEGCVIGSVPLRKRAPIEVDLEPHRICIRRVPQEPRRPRFSFFHLHNVKELTPGSSFEGDVGGSFRFRILANRTLSPVARQHRLPFSRSLTVGATSARRRQRGGLYSRRSSLSTPYLKFRISSRFQRFRRFR